MTPFVFNGQTYSVDPQGTIYGPNGAPVSSMDQGNIALQQAAAQATSGTNTTATTPVTPTDAGAPAPEPGALPATPPRLNAYGTAGEPANSMSNPPPAVASAQTPATTNAPALPTTAPRAGAGSAVEDRKTRDAIQKQIDDINAHPANGTDGLSREQSTLLASLTNRVTSLTEQINKAEATPAKSVPGSIIGTPTPTDQFILRNNPDGTDTVVTEKNPIWDQKSTKPQTVTVGNKVLNVATDGTVKVAYDDTDAQQLAQKQTAVLQQNANTAAKAQAATELKQQLDAQIADLVARGLDAKSLRDQRDQDLTAAHQAWVQADGDRKAAQQALDSYNVERHATARDTQGQETIDNTAAQQARQDATANRQIDVNAATSKYGYDTTAATTHYTADTAAHTARLQAATSMVNAGLGQIFALNKDLPPGSDLAGKAIPGFLAYIRDFVNDMAGPSPTAPGAPKPPGAPATPPTDQPPADQPIIPDVAAPATAPLDEANRALLPPGVAGTPADPNVGPTPPPAPVGGASLDWLMNNPTSPITNTANTPPAAPPAAPTMPDLSQIDTTGSSLATQNAASHAQTMSWMPMGPVAPDGSPWATPADVAARFGRGGTT